jgi:hypothetical protein
MGCTYTWKGAGISFAISVYPYYEYHTEGGLMFSVVLIVVLLVLAVYAGMHIEKESTRRHEEFLARKRLNEACLVCRSEEGQEDPHEQIVTHDLMAALRALGVSPPTQRKPMDLDQLRMWYNLRGVSLETLDQLEKTIRSNLPVIPSTPPAESAAI